MVFLQDYCFTSTISFYLKHIYCCTCNHLGNLLVRSKYQLSTEVLLYSFQKSVFPLRFLCVFSMTLGRRDLLAWAKIRKKIKLHLYREELLSWLTVNLQISYLAESLFLFACTILINLILNYIHSNSTSTIKLIHLPLIFFP